MLFPLPVPRYVTDEETGEEYPNPIFDREEDFTRDDPYDEAYEEWILRKNSEGK